MMHRTTNVKARYCCYKSVSGLVSVVFVYKSSLKLSALLLNRAIEGQQVVIHCLVVVRRH
jgi:hypothetical protein